MNEPDVQEHSEEYNRGYNAAIDEMVAKYKWRRACIAAAPIAEAQMKTCRDLGVAGATIVRTPDASAPDDEGRALELLHDIRQWDVLDTTADGDYWKRKIDAVLAVVRAHDAKSNP